MTFLRRIIQWVVVPVVVIGLIGALYLQGRVDEQIRHEVEQRFADHYADLAVKVHGARLVAGEGIEVRGLSISLPNATDKQGELLYVDELFVQCNTELDQLIRGQLDIRHLVVRRPVIRACPDANGKWNVAKLLPLPNFGGTPPSGEFEHAMVELTDPARGVGRTFAIRDLNLSFKPQPSGTDPSKHDFVVAGSLGADYTREVEFKGKFAADGKSWFAKGKINDLDHCPELCQALPTELAKKLLPLASLRAQVSAEYQLDFDSARANPWRYAISGAVNRGRIDDARLPYPLTDLTASFKCDTHGLSVHELTARNGQTTLSLDLQRHGHQPGAPWTLTADSRQVELDELFRVLPMEYRSEWRKFLPKGTVNAHLEITFDGKNYHPEATVQCLGVSFYYFEFPYRLNETVGTIIFRDRKLHANLTAYAGNREISIEGEMFNPGKLSQGYLRVRANDLPLDKPLFDALKTEIRPIVNSLKPTGSIGVDLYFHRDAPGDPKLHKQLAISFKHCAICYDHFPYPLQNISGRLDINDDHWNFTNIEGVNDTGRVVCWGVLAPVDQGGNLLTLHFDATNVPLEPELRDALRPGMQRIWSDLRPQGTLGLNADVLYWTATKQLDVRVRGNASPQHSSTPVMIEPVYFPYRLEELNGSFDYHNGRVELTNLRARHRDTAVSASGTCNLESDGRWSFELKPLVVDHMRIDRELAQALPPRLADGIAELNPVGTMALNGKLGFSGSGVPQEPMQVNWDVNLDLHQVAAQCGVPLENMHGGVRLYGEATPTGFVSRGDLKLDHATYEGFQFTNVRGPIYLDERGFALGRWVNGGAPAANAPRMTAQFYGGELRADARSERRERSPFEVYAELTGADLRRMTREKFPGRQNLSGSVDGRIHMWGAGKGLHNLRGKGEMQLNDANIYELPQMVQLLSLLSVKPPEQNAFSKSNVWFDLDGARFDFKRIQFEGSALSLYGRGEMDFERRVKANFYTMVGNHRIPGLSDLIGSASQQIMVVHANGPLDSLSITNEVLPGVNDMLEQLQNEWGVPLTGAPTTVTPPATGAATSGKTKPLGWLGLQR